MNAQSPPEPSQPSTAWFILHRERNEVVELAVTEDGRLLMRHSNAGMVMAQIPLGPCTQGTISQIQERLDDLADLFLRKP